MSRNKAAASKAAPQNGTQRHWLPVAQILTSAAAPRFCESRSSGPWLQGKRTIRTNPRNALRAADHRTLSLTRAQPSPKPTKHSNKVRFLKYAKRSEERRVGKESR